MAAVFDNVDDNIRCGTVSIATNITLEAWIYSDSYAQLSVIIVKELINANWLFYTTATALTLRGGGSASDLSVPIANLTDGQWHHVAATIQGTAGIIYIDGISKASGTVVAIGNSVLDINIGNFDAANTIVWDGRIAYVRVWNDVRTPEEISAYMYRRVAANEQGLVADWPLDEQTGTNAADHQTNIARNDGTLELFAAGSEWGDGPPITYGE